MNSPIDREASARAEIEAAANNIIANAPAATNKRSEAAKKAVATRKLNKEAAIRRADELEKNARAIRKPVAKPRISECPCYRIARTLTYC